MRKNRNISIEAKFESNWMSKSLESLEKDYWGEPDYGSYLVTTTYKLRKKQLKDYEIEDLRIMISENIGLKYLIPLAILILDKDILAEGDFYEGDLFYSVIESDKEYWEIEIDNWKKLCQVFEKNRSLLENDYTTKDIRIAFTEFEKINKSLHNNKYAS